MLIIVVYDVNTETASGRRRLRKIAKECVNYGQRVQNSVFECSLDYTQYKLLKVKLNEIIDKNKDSLIFYNLGNKYSSKTEYYGRRVPYKSDDFLSI